MSHDRRAWLAALLSIFTPGLGHLYAGSVLRAVVWWLAALAAVALTPALVLHFPIGRIAAFASWAVPIGFLVVPAAAAARAARRAPRPYELRAYNRWWVYPTVWLGSVGFTQVVARPFLHRSYEAFRIPSASMEPAIMMGDFLYMAKPARHPAPRGAIVVFTSVEETGLKVIKRVVAVAGDTVGMRAGRLMRDGGPADEPYAVLVPERLRSESPEYREKMRRWQQPHLAHPDTAYAPNLNDWGPLVVPADSVFVLGDNREQSYDSRFWGFLPESSILGEPRLVYYSYDPEGPGAFRWWTAARWDRIGLRFR